MCKQTFIERQSVTCFLFFLSITRYHNIFGYFIYVYSYSSTCQGLLLSNVVCGFTSIMDKNFDFVRPFISILQYSSTYVSEADPEFKFVRRGGKIM